MTEARPWRRFYSSLPAQTLIALSFNIGSLFAGSLISLFSPWFKTASWVLALFPPILTVRGNISGILSGNLTTMLHLGLIQPKIRRNTDAYRKLIAAVFVLTFINTISMGTISFALNIFLGRASLSQLYIYTCVPSISAILAVTLSVPLTSLVAIAAYKRGLDPDVLVYPILASFNDIVVTASFVGTASLVITGGATFNALVTVFLSLLFVCIFLIWRNQRAQLFSKTIREGTSIVIPSSILGGVNGLLLSSLTENLMRYPGLVVLYPGLTNMLGSIGSIVGSVTTTSLALGYVRSFKEEVKEGLKRIFQVESVAALMHIVLGVIAYMIVAPTLSGASLLFLVEVALVSNLNTFLIISLFALIVAFFSYKRGLNPDNVVIPAISSISDTVATLSMLPSIYILKMILTA